jgi:hypothetical protein
VLVERGRLIIASFCYLPLPSTIATGGFRELTSFSYDVDVPFTHESWRGRIRACSGVAATMSPDEVARFDSALWPEPLSVLHRLFVISGIS